jgi:hypothetical protein
MARAVGRFDTRHVDAMPIDTPQLDDSTHNVAKMINLVPSGSSPTKKYDTTANKQGVRMENGSSTITLLVKYAVILYLFKRNKTEESTFRLAHDSHARCIFTHEHQLLGKEYAENSDCS